jgi:hypothetical protein
MIPVSTQTFYARKWPIFLIFLLLGGSFLILKVNGEEDKSLDLFLLIISVFCLLLYVWGSKMFVSIDNEGITYKIIFRKTFISWKDITRTKLAFEFHGKSGDFIWNFTSKDNKQISFSTGYFSKNTIRAIAEAVVEKCPHFVIEGKITDISNGKFPWYIF